MDHIRQMQQLQSDAAKQIRVWELKVCSDAGINYKACEVHWDTGTVTQKPEPAA